MGAAHGISTCEALEKKNNDMPPLMIGRPDSRVREMDRERRRVRSYDDFRDSKTRARDKARPKRGPIIAKMLEFMRWKGVTQTSAESFMDAYARASGITHQVGEFRLRQTGAFADRADCGDFDDEGARELLWPRRMAPASRTLPSGSSNIAGLISLALFISEFLLHYLVELSGLFRR